MRYFLILALAATACMAPIGPSLDCRPELEQLLDERGTPERVTLDYRGTVAAYTVSYADSIFVLQFGGARCQVHARAAGIRVPRCTNPLICGEWEPQN